MKFLQFSPQGSVLLGAISYGKLSYVEKEEGKNPLKSPVSYQISYIVPPNKVFIYAVLYCFPIVLRHYIHPKLTDQLSRALIKYTIFVK